MIHFIKHITYFKLLAFNFILCYEAIEDSSILYDNAVLARRDGSADKALKYLHKIENFHLESNYLIAEIYLNEVKNPNIAMDYYKLVFLKTSNFAENQNEVFKNLNRKSLFMISYIYSNYLGMYSDAIDNYNLFLELFNDDELQESVYYELELLKPFALQKKQMIGNKNG